MTTHFQSREEIDAINDEYRRKAEGTDPVSVLSQGEDYGLREFARPDIFQMSQVWQVCHIRL